MTEFSKIKELKLKTEEKAAPNMRERIPERLMKKKNA